MLKHSYKSELATAGYIGKINSPNDRWVTTTTGTNPYATYSLNVFSTPVTEDEIPEKIYRFLVDRRQEPFTVEGFKVELSLSLGLYLDNGELLSILIQMVNDDILSFDRQTARYCINQ